MKNILITGGSGLLATNWAQIQRSNYNITLGLHNRIISLEGVNIQKIYLDSIEDFELDIIKVNPDIIIHTAALSNVEQCEKNEHLANHINVKITENIAYLCKKYDIKLVHISTDHLFKGDQSLLVETSSPSPLNVYARTKAEAELKALTICPNSLIIRTNFFGWGPIYKHSFSDTIIKTLNNGSIISLFNDVFYTPILISELVKIVHKLLEINESGIFHVFGKEKISKYDFGIKLANIFNLNSSLIKPISIKERIDLVKRPSDMSLANSRLESLNLNNISSLEKQLYELKKNELLSITNELKIK